MADELPNSNFTPGVARKDITVEQICSTKWSKDPRSVTSKMRSTVYHSYNVTKNTGACALSARGCELDHLISRELGGADDIKNLWTQPYGGSCNAVQKDQLENYLHKMVCYGGIKLEDAQKMIATDWIKAYTTYIDPKGCK